MRKTDSFGETRLVPCTYLAHHELESNNSIIVIMYVITADPVAQPPEALPWDCSDAQYGRKVVGGSTPYCVST